MTPTIRSARPEDADPIASIHVDAWRAGYRDILEDALLESLSESGRAMTWRETLRDPPPRSEVFVAVADDQIVGFVSCGPARDEDLYQFDVGEIYALYVDPDRWRRGIGSDLLRRAVEYFGGEDFDFMSLWVLEENDAARAFYETAGFVPDHTYETDEHEGYELDKMRYRGLLT